MKSDTNKILAEWLKLLGLPISSTYLDQILRSHPSYPSLESMTDTLDFLQIENSARLISTDDLKELSTPFIVHVQKPKRRFAIVQNERVLREILPMLDSEANVIVLIAKKAEGWEHESNSMYLTKGKAHNTQFLFLGAIIALIVAVNASLSVLAALILVLSLAGLFIASLIVNRELGIQNNLSDQICGKESDCNLVIRSRSFKLMGLKWSDLGIIWFSTMFCSALQIYFITNRSEYTSYLSLLSILALPITFISIYYQYFKIRAWCRLCLLIVATAWLQFAILLPSLSLTSLYFVSPALPLLTILQASIIACIWVLVKATIEKKLQLQAENEDYRKLKRNYIVFKELLKQQRKVEYSQLEEALQFGNPSASLQLLLVADPFCIPCAKAHKAIDALLNKVDAGLIIRFYTNTEKKREAAKQILLRCHKVSSESKRMILNDWYNSMNVNAFIETHKTWSGINISEITEIINKHESWSAKAGIYETPSIFINGYAIPKFYSIEELCLILLFIKEELFEMRSLMEVEIAKEITFAEFDVE